MGLLDLLSPGKRGGPRARGAEGLYAAAVAQARAPLFYTALGVPDTLDGRFDLILLHVHMLCRRLAREGEEGAATAQALFDGMFRDMDRNLREMGVGDPSVPRRIRAMIEAYYGRVKAYETALAVGGEALSRTIARNVYNASPEAGAPWPDGAAALADYVRRAVAALDAADRAALVAGHVAFPAVFLPRE
ncbi:MAG: ubiquinol-cytochrome C chaperone family protein [Alphaproteobacteria bacterium]